MVQELSTDKVGLRGVAKEDLPIFFGFQLDSEANHMAAFTSKDPSDRAAFDAHWAKIMADENVIIKTIILSDGRVIGSVAKYERDGRPEVTYWVGRQYWGKGFATMALAMFLDQIKTRPIYAGAAKDNAASIRVLEKCGFKLTGSTKGFANARGQEIEEVTMVLASDK